MTRILSLLALLVVGLTPLRAADKKAALPVMAFDSIDVVFPGPDTLHFGATLTLPQTKGRRPALVIASGSYPQDRDGMMAGHAIYRQIAEYLSARGIAVLRVDDRGVGRSNGIYDRATTADFANDVVSAVSYLKSRKDIDSRRIGVLGHSEGAASASIAAASCNDIAFIVSASGMMSDGLSSVTKQNIDIVHSAPISDYDKARYDSINKLMFQLVYDNADNDSLTLTNKINALYNDWKAKDDARFAKDHPGEFDHFRFPVYMYGIQASSPWYRFMIRYNPADYLSKVKIPVLALNGDKDVMVNAEMNLANVERYLAHNKDVTTVMLPGVNHLLLPCELGTQEEYRSITAPVSEQFLQTVAGWLKAHKLLAKK